MGDEKYFVFQCVPGSVPKYEFHGGTQCYSEMSGLSVEDRIRYVHQHASVKTTDNDTADSNGKSLKRARELFERASKSKGVDSLKNLNRALITLPKEEIDFKREIIERIHKTVLKLNILNEDMNISDNKLVSKKLKVVYKEGVGRHVIATEDITVGETIVAEVPGVSFLHDSHRFTNCHHCLRSVIQATPCDTCSQVMFCSDTCRHVARRYHDLECGHADIIPGIGPLAPVLRILTSRPVEFFLERRDYLEKYDRTSDIIDHGDEFDNLFSLQAGNKKDSQYKILKAANAYYLLYLLKKMNYFTNNDRNTVNEEHLIVGRFLEHFLRIADDNCHEICELDTPKVTKDKSFDELFDTDDSAVSVVGVGIYPTISLFNNCCDVNTFKYHVGSREVVMARRDIKAGEEISDFYGEYFFNSSKLTRKKNLGKIVLWKISCVQISSLGFICGCVACAKDWPLLDDLPGFTYEDVEDRYDWAVQRVALESALTHVDVTCIRDICTRLGTLVHVSGPHQATVMPEMYLAYSHLYLSGNSSLKFKLLKNKINLSLTEKNNK